MEGSSRRDLKELAGLFLKLGATAFGGPAAHISMMENEVVRRRAWMSREEFLDLLGTTNLIPGPSSTKMALYVGLARGGWPGFFLAGLGFILPASAIVIAFAWAYVKFGSLPAVPHFLEGIKPVVLALILQALVALGRTAVKTRWLGALAFAALAASFVVHEFLLLIGAGCVSAVTTYFFLLRGKEKREAPPTRRGAVLPLGPGSLMPYSLSKQISLSPLLFASTLPSISLLSLFLVFLKVGAILFGSGYVLLAFLRADLVERLHWLTNAQLLDAVAVGQFTPGPLSSTATFIGYVLAGLPGAAVATVGIFLPAFIFVAVSGPFVPKLRRSRLAGAFLDGVNVAALALMAGVSLQLARSAVTNVPTAVLFLASLAILLVVRINAAWLVLAGGLLGVLFG